MLHVLVRDVKSSHQYSSGYRNKRTSMVGNHSWFVTITSRPAPNNSDVELGELGDDRSDRSVLGNNGLGSQAKNGIVQVTDITIKYEETYLDTLDAGSSDGSQSTRK
jgi:hypothetical protein